MTGRPTRFTSAKEIHHNITPLAVSGLPVLEFAEQGRDSPNPAVSEAILAAVGPRLWVYNLVGQLRHIVAALLM
jgi:hypothetical protein